MAQGIFQGRTAQEFHREQGWPPGAKCAGCGARPAVRCIIMAPYDECVRRGMLPASVLNVSGELNAALARVLVPLKEGDKPKPYLRVSVAYACTHHRRDLQREAAKAPSWCVVEFNEGPNPTERVQVSVC